MLGILNAVPMIIWIGLALLLIILFLYFPNFRILVGTFLVVILIGSAIWSVSKLNKYFNAEGGVFGHLVSIISPVQANGNLSEISLDNAVFTKNNDEYEISVKLNGNYELNPEADYLILVNGKPCCLTSLSDDYVVFTYEYAFYDENFNLKEVDTLKFNLALYENYCQIKVTTAGTANTVKLWQSYFEKENFVISITEVNLDNHN